MTATFPRISQSLCAHKISLVKVDKTLPGWVVSIEASLDGSLHDTWIFFH